MLCNIGKTDRQLRIGAGIVIIALGVVSGSWWGALGLLPLATGIMRWCPAYAPFGIKTGSADDASPPARAATCMSIRIRDAAEPPASASGDSFTAPASS